MRLRRTEYCPIHKSIICYGRELIAKPSLGVQRVADPYHSRGYRELRSPAELRKLLNRQIVEQDRECAICHKKFTDYSDIVPEHKEPKGMGGAWKEDHPDNIEATHWWCNEQKGATRMED
jgi:HNH endonuclease